ncbi:uncharacterized protein UTRI_03635_B [Ustilago trichophora]|uniref:Uncharacterized protein n=1 Tax=Ustilago trichophora TaxID=86804 RepID=A0A5C3E0H1_9BASI|nr:uncharacterized protein UTRI_03635_B [Ustilago trichophora]
MVLMGYLESTSTGIVRLTRKLEGSPASKARKEHFEAFIKRMELNGRLGGPQFDLPIKGSDWNEFWEQIQRDEAAGASQAASSAEGNAADEGSSNASQQPKSSSRSKLKSFLRNLF